jgi:tRNA-2-methylthio-N6-dimethylallyladenosine synthase
MFLGQTVNSYGRDLNPRIRFEKLIFETSLIDEVKRIRFTSPHPAEFKQSFIELYSKLPKLCPHIHLPLQSGSDKILRDMNRNYRIKRYMDIIEQLKLQAPNIAITTDIIVGFPGETDEDFEHTLRIMKEVNFSFSYSFKYSIRPNTVAKQNWPLAMQVPEEVKSQRLLQLQDLQESLSLNYNKSKIGHTVEVLVESKKQESEQLLRGRTPDNILIDVAVDDSNDYQLGELVYPKVSSVSAYGLKGTLVN